MAKKRLDLKVERIPYPEEEFQGDEYFKISWNDYYNERGSPIVALIVIGLGVMLMFAAPSAVPLVVLGTFVAVVLVVRYTVNVDVKKPKHINIGKHWVFFDGKRYDLKSVTRFDYGLRSQFTGVAPEERAEKFMYDPHQIRMWIDDNYPITISENVWQGQVNHEIRDYINKAFMTVKDEVEEEYKSERYGTVKDDGLPDYD